MTIKSEKHFCNSRQKRVENTEVDQLAQAVLLDNSFENLTKTQTEWAKAKIGLILFVQNDLVDAEHTIYGQLPNDWELCSD